MSYAAVCAHEMNTAATRPDAAAAVGRKELLSTVPVGRRAGLSLLSAP
jgi:hypothetical protein